MLVHVPNRANRRDITREVRRATADRQQPKAGKKQREEQGFHKIGVGLPFTLAGKLGPGSRAKAPRGIIDHLKLRRPIFKKTAAYGHFGRNEPEFTWEKTDQVSALRGLK